MSNIYDDIADIRQKIRFNSVELLGPRGVI